MSTSLWPALLAAVLGGRQQHQHHQQQQEEQQQMMMTMQQERALHPIQALLYLSVLGEHALYWWIGIVCFVGLAYATNPSEASFKTHLTDLSFHLHLRRLRAQDPDSLHGSGNSSTLPGDFRRSSTSASSSGGQSIASSASSASSTKDAITSTAGSTNTAGAKINSNATAGGGKSKNTNNHNNVVNHQAGNSTSIEIKQRNVSSSNKQRLSPHNHSSNGGAGGVESGRPHVLSFSNRVSISLKTPAYVRTSYALWSTVRILPATPSSSSQISSSSSSAKAVGGGSKGSNTTTTTATAGTPGRPILNGVPAVTRRASTTLPGLNDRSSKKSSSTSGSGSSSSSSSSSSSKNANSRKGGLVSTVAHGISASLASPVCSPWLEQGGYFIGFLGYWWTVDDGTSFSGAREKLRLGNALLAVEEQDEEDDVSVDQHGPEAARNADDLEGGHAFYDNGHAHSQVARAENQSNSSQQHMNGSSSNTTTSKRKQQQQQQQQQPSKASHGASMRGGQRRSSPTPRQVSNKKRGSGSGAATAATGSGGGGSAQASQVNSSGDVTPITPHSTVPLDRSRLEREGHQLLSTNDDSQLPGLPFHVDRNSRDVVDSNAAAQEDHRQFATVKEGAVNVASGEIVGVDGQTVQGVTLKEGEDAISTISHSASGPESTVATVSPALALLQSQLDDLRTSSAATQARLEAEVEELQIRKRDEDAVRTELKARTKILEESKREAELERLDAEKKLISARSVKKSVEDRVTKARSELSKLEKKEKEVQEKIQRAREERRIKLDSLREDVKKREALLVKEEEATEKLNKRVADLEKEIEERKHDLFQFRREEANAAAVAVTNRMNRAGRGLGPGPHPHTHGHGPHSGAAVTAKRHMHPPPHAHTTAHRHPSQHPNAAVPVAYPYISPEDQAKQSGNQARSSSPGATTPPLPSSQISTTATGSAANTAPGASSNVEGGQTFGSAFMDHRMQSRRAASAAGTLGGQASAAGANHPVHSNVNTSVIGNAAGGLHNRHQLDRGEDDGNEFDDLEDIDGDDHDYESRNLAPGSTFAPFGPASPTSPSTIGAPSPRGQHGRLNASPGLAHMPYFASDKSVHQASQQPQNRLRMSTSREDFLAAMRSEVIEDDDHDHHARELDTTPVMRLASELAEDETDSYVLAKPRAITASGKREQGGRTGGLRRESFDSVGSFTSSNGGPLSPMTPHQASLIPSQLFDMLDDVEMPASPTPYQVAGGVQAPHHTFTQGISDAFDRADNNDNSQPQQVAGTGGASRRGPGMYSPWADFDIDAGFDFDKPLGYGASASAGVSRKPSGKDGLAHHANLLRRRSGSPIGSGAFDATSSGAVNSGEGVFASYGPTHGHHGSVGSAGQRSNTSSSGGSISPSLMAAAQGHQQQQHQQHSGGNSAMNFPAGFGKLSPNDLLFDKARHVLSLNPDAKAFSFNRPLPSSGSAGSLSSIGGGSKQGGHNLPSNAVGAIGDARLAFDNAGAGSQISSGSGSDSPKLVNNSIAPGNATWASPNLSNRGLHNLGYGTGNAGGSGGNTLRESVRSASGPPLTNPTSSTGHSSSFSPFDDDDLLKGW